MNSKMNGQIRKNIKNSFFKTRPGSDAREQVPRHTSTCLHVFPTQHLINPTWHNDNITSQHIKRHVEKENKWVPPS